MENATTLGHTVMIEESGATDPKHVSICPFTILQNVGSIKYEKPGVSGIQR